MNDETKQILDHWPAAEPPEGFADRVLAREADRHVDQPAHEADRRGAQIARDPDRAGVRSSRFARRLALGLAACVLLALAFVGARRFASAPVSGNRTLVARETIALGRRGLAVAEPGARLAWSIAASGEAQIEQTSGDVFYRVEPAGPFVVSTPAGDVAATGTCFRVEVDPMAAVNANAQVNAKMVKLSAASTLAGAALASLVWVTVYEGRVHASGGAAGVELSAGDRGQLARGEAPRKIEAAPFPAAPISQGSGAMSASALTGPAATSAAARENALTAQLVEQRAHIAALEKALARANEQPGDAGDGRFAFDKVRGFTPEELRKMADSCQLMMGLPGYAQTSPVFNPSTAEKLGVTDSERAQVNGVLSAQNDAFMQSLRALYVELTHDTTGADALDAQAMEQEILAKSRPADTSAARQALARERAGLSPPPASTAGEPVIERLLRLQSGESDSLQSALTNAVGAGEAERLIDGLTPMHMAHGGCPDAQAH